MDIPKVFSVGLRAACALHLLVSNVYVCSETYGESMLPTLNYTGDWVHINKLQRRGKDCQVGDIVIASKPTDPESPVCKRILGMPGDCVLVDPSESCDQMIKVPQGHVWLAGDNMPQSLDSRSYGPLPMALIKGKVFGASNGFNFRSLD